MLDELEGTNTIGVELSQAESTLQDWAGVRLWRKVKRQVLIKRRLAIPEGRRAAHSEAITTVLSRMLESSGNLLVGFYWPFKGEYDPRLLVRTLYSKGMRLALPVVVETARPLVFREWWPGMSMSHGVWNIPVPAEGNPVLPDVLLVPLVGFDKRGYRLGYGGGYYDRTLAATPVRPRAISIGFEQAEVPTIHPQSHDIAMDLIVTERRILDRAIQF